MKYPDHPIRNGGDISGGDGLAAAGSPISRLMSLAIMLGAVALAAAGFLEPGTAIAQELVPPNSSDPVPGDADPGALRQRPLSQMPTAVQTDDFDGRVRAIHERIELIRSLMEREKEAEHGAAAVATEPAVTDTPPTAAVSLAATPDRMQARPTFENTPPLTAGSSEAEPSATPMPPTIPLDAEPVEAFELASSLYMTGNYAKAREIYERLLKKTLPREQAAWARVLLANCLWHLGETDQAEIVYRDLTREKEGLYPVEFARLSLTELDRHRRIAGRWAAIESELNQYLNQPSEGSQDE